MRCTQREDVRQFYLAKLRDILAGKVGVPSMKLDYTKDPAVIHAHECELCPAKHYFSRTVVPTPPLSDRAVLIFMRGRLFERILADELPAAVKDGIAGRVDGLYPPDGTLIETKSTTMDMSKFDPLTSQPHWLQRSKAYCTLHGVNKLLLVVWFLIGDMWIKKTTPTGLKCWELEFDDVELGRNWEYMLLQKDTLLECIKVGSPPSDFWISERAKPYEHGDCMYYDICTYSRKGERK